MKNYIVDKQILMVSVLEDKTPAKSDMVEVLFEDGTKVKMPKLRFELIVSDAPSTLSDVNTKLKQTASGMIFGMLHEYGVKWGEVNGIVDSVVDLVNSAFEKASNVKWGVEDKDLITLNDINNTLLKHHEQENNDGVASVGSESDTSDQK